MPTLVVVGAEALLIGLGILSLFSLGVALAVQAGYKYTLGHLLEAIASALDAATIPIPHFHIGHPLRPVARQVRRANTAVYHLIGLWVAVSEKGAVLLFHGVAKIAEWVAHEIASLAKTVFHLFRHIILGIIPRLFRRLVKYLLKVARHVLGRAFKFARHLFRRLWHALRGLRKLVSRALRWALHAIKIALKFLLRRLIKLERYLLRRFRALERKIHPRLWFVKLFKALLRGVNWAAVVLAALVRLGLGWLRARAIVRIAKAIVRLSWDVVEGIVAVLSVLTHNPTLEEFEFFMHEELEPIIEVTEWFWSVR